MRSPIPLFRWIARAVIDAVADGLPLGESLVEEVPGISRHVWEGWSTSVNETLRQSQIEAVALILDSEAPLLAAEVVAEMAADQPEAVHRFVRGYLTRVPASARAALRRQSDPCGMFVPPDLVPGSADELARFLPSRLPRFEAGDRPAGLGWELVRFLGVGGFGEVWKARHLSEQGQPPVAITFCTEPTAAHGLRNESSLLDRLQRVDVYPGIVRLLDTHLDTEPCCLIYEYVEQGDLTGLIRSWHRKGRRPAPAEAARLVRQIAEAIGTTHRLDPPIVHRDLKPANVLVGQADDGSARIKITDFGIGGLATHEAHQHDFWGRTPGQILVRVPRGSFTPLYASPEQVGGADPDPRDDVFALGVIWFQLITGQLGEGRPISRSWPERLQERGMSPQMIDLLIACVEDEREDRPADAQSLSEEIAALLDPAALPGTARGSLSRCNRPKTAPAYVNRGLACYERKDYTTALADYDQAIRLNPNLSLASNNRGLVRYVRRQYAAAVADADQAVRLDPGSDFAYRNRGNARMALGDLDGVLRDYDQAIRLDPESAISYYDRGLARKLKGDIDGALNDFINAAQRNPGDSGYRKQVQAIRWLKKWRGLWRLAGG